MALGGYVFRGLGFSFTGQGRELNTSWASLKTIGRFDALQWTGPQSDSFSIKGALFDEAFGGQASLDGIRGAAKSGKALMLVTGDGRVHGRHVVEGVSEERDRISASGQARKNSYSIKLKRYTGDGGGVLDGIVSLFT